MAERIELKQVSYQYRTGQRDVLAVDDVSFSVEPSAFLCVLGPSGCGKTTIMNMIAGFLAPTRGEIRIGGAPITGKGPSTVCVSACARLMPPPSSRLCSNRVVFTNESCDSTLVSKPKAIATTPINTSAPKPRRTHSPAPSDFFIAANTPLPRKIAAPSAAAEPNA